MSFFDKIQVFSWGQNWFVFVKIPTYFWHKYIYIYIYIYSLLLLPLGALIVGI
jgi:hypothetical protein